MKLSIIIPAYNESKRIRPTLDVYLDYFERRFGDQVEFIIVVNGSRDDTEDVARSYQDRHACLQVLVEPRAIGKGGALMMGMREARGEAIGFIDADGSTPPHAFDSLVAQMGDAGAVIASRWFPESIIDPPQTLRRRAASRIFNFLVRTLFGLPITDTQCGAKIIRREAVQDILPRLGLTRWAFDVDLLFQLRRAGYRIVEAPTEWHDVGGSQLRIGKASLEMFLAIVRLRLLHSPFAWVVSTYDKSLGRFIKLRTR